MNSSKTILFVFIILVLSSSVLAGALDFISEKDVTEKEITDGLTIYNKITDTKDITIDYVEEDYKIKDKKLVPTINTKIRNLDSALELKGVDNIDYVNKIEFKKSARFDTDEVTIKNISLDYATVTLRKNKIGYVSEILWSDDELTFYDAEEIKIYQNVSHIWFNTTHFSTYTGSMGNINLNYGDSVYLYYGEIFNIDEETDYVCVEYYDEYNTQTNEVCGQHQDNTAINYLSPGVENYRIYVDLRDYNTTPTYIGDYFSWYIRLRGYDEDYTTSSIVFKVRNSDGSLDQESESIRFSVGQYLEPKSSGTYSGVTSTQATIKGTIDKNDFSGTVYGYFRIKEINESTWHVTGNSNNTITDDVQFTYTVTNLTSNTLYVFQVVAYWYDSYHNYRTDTSYQFGTNNDPIPISYTFNNMDTTNDSVTLRGLSDFDGWTSDVWGSFAYCEYDSCSYSFTTPEPVGDSVIYSEPVSGLKNGTTYQYYYISNFTYDNGTSDITTGFDSLDYFTTDVAYQSYNNSYGSDLNDAILLYYKLEETTTNYIDSVNNVHLTTGNIPNRDTGIINYGQDFDSANIEYLLTGSNSNLELLNPVVSVWVTPESNNQITGIVTTKANTGNVDGFSVERANDANNNKVIVYACGSGNCDTFLSTSSLTSSNTYHIFAWFDGDIHLCLNGVEEGSEIAEQTTTIGYDLNKFGVGTDKTDSQTKGFNGIIDEVSYYNGSAFTPSCEYAEFLYNEGSPTTDHQYPFIDGGSAEQPTVETLTASSIYQTNATLRGVADFGDFTGDVYGTFRYRSYGFGSWNYVGETNIPVTEGVTFTYPTPNNLISNTPYEYFAELTWYDGESLNANGSYVNFTTQAYTAGVSGLNAIENSTTSYTLYGTLALNDLLWTSVIFRYAPYEDILNGNASYNDSSSVNLTTNGTFQHEIFNLTTLTEYGFYITYLNEIDLYNTGLYAPFTPGETSLPDIDNQDVIVFSPEIVRFDADLVSLGDYDNATITFEYTLQEEIGSNYTMTNSYFADSVPQNYSFFVYGLINNTNYAMRLNIDYGGANNLTTGHIYFTTLGYNIPNATQPVMFTNSETDRATGFFYIYNNSADDIFYRLFINDSINDSTDNFTTEWTAFTSDGVTETFIIDGVSSTYTLYARGEILYSNGTSNRTLYTDFTSFSFDEVTNGEVTVLGNFKIYVTDAHLFSLLLIVGISVIGIGLIGAYGSFGNSTGAERFLVYALLGLTIFAIIFLKLSSLIATWQLIVSLFGVAVMGLYYVISGNGGGVYG